MEKTYSIQELVDSIISEYQLNCNDSGSFHIYYQRIYRALVKTNIINNAIEKINPSSNRKYKVFTEQQKQNLLSEKNLYDYLRDHSSSNTIYNSKRYKEIQQIITSRRNERITRLDELSEQPPTSINENTFIISPSEFQQYKNNMMLTALFERFFTPINDSLLLNDMNRLEFIRDDLALEVEDIEAEQRMSHPEGNYYHKKDVTN